MKNGLDKLPSVLAITLGDPNGLGPELVCRFFNKSSEPAQKSVFLILGPEKALLYTCSKLGIDPFWSRLAENESIEGLSPGIYLYPLSGQKELTISSGEARVDGGLAAGLALKEACQLAREKRVQGVVTCPLNKEMLIKAGYDFPGHTEFLANEANLSGKDVCMHLAGPRLRVSLVTRHQPIAMLPELIEKTRILRSLSLTWDHLQRIKMATKPIAVCGLNPHAGEGGKIGREELEILTPAIIEAQKNKIEAVGPISGDTAFYRAWNGEFSAVLAMYHDQGLAPLKLVHFHQAVNITLGLPFVRTSVDHGTGYDLVGTGLADLDSFTRAVDMAVFLIDNPSEEKHSIP